MMLGSRGSMLGALGLGLGLVACGSDDVPQGSADGSGSSTAAMSSSSEGPSPDSTGTRTTGEASSEGTSAASSTGSDTSTGSTGGTATDTGTTSASGPVCGNGVLEDGEACDGSDLGGASCEDFGFTRGALACDGACTIDATACSDAPAVPGLALAFSPIRRFDFSWAAVAGADVYRLEESASPGDPFVQLGGDLVGTAVSLPMPLHLRWDASYRLLACNAAGCTASAVVPVASALVEAVGYVKATNTDGGDTFGYALAFAADGNTLAIGAYNEDGSVPGIDGDQTSNDMPSAGAVYVLVRDAAGQWTQQAYVKASNPGMLDVFGISVALSDDGNTLAVGAGNEDSSATGIGGDQANDAATLSGATYVLVRDGAGQWSQQAYIKASNTGAFDGFGNCVALSSDGNTLAVGAPNEDGSSAGVGGDPASNGTSDAGAAYVFVRDGAGAWSQQAYVKASNPNPMDFFGRRLALAGDGNTLAVGAMTEDGSSTGIDGDAGSNDAIDAGAAYVFVRDGAGAWSQQAYVKAINTDPGDFFGSAVALSDDGDLLAVGAQAEDGGATGIDGDPELPGVPATGAVYLLERDAAGEWSHATYVKASNPGGTDFFGAAVALSEAGDVLAVGSYLEDSDALGVQGDQASEALLNAGAAYVLVRDGAGAWSQAAYVKASNTGTSDYFGAAVALSGDGSVLAVGAYQEASDAFGIGADPTDDSLPSAGAVYLY